MFLAEDIQQLPMITVSDGGCHQSLRQTVILSVKPI
jgi:hypothetical protein